MRIQRGGVNSLPTGQGQLAVAQPRGNFLSCWSKQPTTGDSAQEFTFHGSGLHFEWDFLYSCSKNVNRKTDPQRYLTQIFVI